MEAEKNEGIYSEMQKIKAEPSVFRKHRTGKEKGKTTTKRNTRKLIIPQN